MAESVEILMDPNTSMKATRMLTALAGAIARHTRVVVTKAYQGACDWVVIYGYGAPDRDAARKAHVRSGRHAWLWDLGYFDRQRVLRCSIDHDHPQAYLDRTFPEPSRFDSLKIKLREDANPDGHILLIGLGRKSRAYLDEQQWEKSRLATLRHRFPGRDIIYRPKPGSPPVQLDCKADGETPIETLLRGCALVSCRHSNVAVDAAVAGVPFECEDGAAMWLQAKPYTRENRLDFLRRLVWWQWRPEEAGAAWKFIQTVQPAKELQHG